MPQHRKYGCARGCGLPAPAWRNRFLVVTLLSVQSVVAAYGNDTDQWFTIRFNDDPVGYERIRTHDVVFDGRPMQSCFRRTQMNFERLGQNLSVRASLWTRQTEDGILYYFNLQRVDGAGARIERTGHWDAERSVFRITERVAATRRQYDLRLSEPVRSPLMTTWLPRLIGAQRNGLIVSVLFPESANVAKISAASRQNKQVRIDSVRRVNAGQTVFFPQLDPAKRTTLLTDAQHALLRQIFL